MLISVLISRLPDQRAQSTVNYWTVQNGHQKLVRVEWDPLGPMTAGEAAVAGLERALDALRRQMVGGTGATPGG